MYVYMIQCLFFKTGEHNQKVKHRLADEISSAKESVYATLLIDSKLSSIQFIL